MAQKKRMGQFREELEVILCCIEELVSVLWRIIRGEHHSLKQHGRASGGEYPEYGNKSEKVNSQSLLTCGKGQKQDKRPNKKRNFLF